MKELSIEEKAERYDEALERAKNFIENGDESERTIAESIFAGIMEESEDERIRKALIKLVKKAGEGYENVIDGVSIENAISWLEKQGEKGINGNEKEFPFSEQKPAWSEKDEINRDLLYNALNQVYDMEHNKDLSNWVNKRILLCSKQHDWSEEDERIYQSIMDDTVQENQLDGKQTDWLRDIKYRYFSQPQNTWKPSDEQMKTLDDAIIYINATDNFSGNLDVLKNILKQLKKL